LHLQYSSLTVLDFFFVLLLTETHGKKGIKVKHQKTPNRPLEPEDDKLWDEQHDHSKCIADQLKHSSLTVYCILMPFLFASYRDCLERQDKEYQDSC
jgi:hypothetical protein